VAELKVVKKKKGLRLGGGVGESVGGSDLRPRFTPKTPPCMVGCPIGNNVREWIRALRDGLPMEQVWELVTDVNPFPAITGRVCPHPCEGECNRTHLDEAVGINQLERFIGSCGIEQGLAHRKLTDATPAEKIAVVGSGPAGMSFAYQLARRGYAVTVFEGHDKPGGMLRWGIPRYRLPAEILDAEYDKILKLGVTLKCNTRLGKDVSLEDLRKQFAVVYLAIGGQLGVRLGIPGEDGSGVFSGIGLLEDIAAGRSAALGPKVAVIGGGNTAIDAARTARRLGAEVTILYRRTVKEMPADKLEIDEAQEEGVKMEFLVAPLEIVRDAAGKLTGIKCQRMQLGEPDASGRPRPVPIPGSEFVTEATSIIPAVSQAADYAGLEQFRNTKGWITVNETGETCEPGVWAGGDAIIGLGIAAQAIGHGRRAALAVDAALRGTAFCEEKRPTIGKDRMVFDYYPKSPAVPRRHVAPDQRLRSFAESSLTVDPEQAQVEAKRCLSCGRCFSCERCWMFCQYNAVVKPATPGDPYKFKLEFCNGCKKCSEQCPCGFVDMV
jgi:formate dehydrogenase major subunit